MRVKTRDVCETPIALPREEWDFISCPPGCEYYCWGYEFARECPQIRKLYSRAKEPVIVDGQSLTPSFDEHGNWHFQLDLFDPEGEFEDATYLEIPPGFPDTPYLKTHHTPRKSRYTFRSPMKIRNASDAAKIESRLNQPDSFVHLHILWEATDKALIADFARWLKQNRPRAPVSRRGRSGDKRLMADLKALGAYRLLRHFTAEKAYSYTSALGRPLYSKLPDWYEAKRRAKRVLASHFRV